MKKRLLAMALALCMLLGMLPVTAFAAVTGWSAEHGTNPITATGTYVITKADADWTGIMFKAPVEDDYTFTVENGQCGMGGGASYYTYKPAAPAPSYTRNMKANAQFVLMMQSDDESIKLTISRANESSGSEIQYTDYVNVHTPEDALVAAPANPTVLTALSEHTAYKVSDSEYRLDGPDGKQLYVDMRYNGKFDIVAMFGSNGVLSLHGSYNGTAYDFFDAMKAYHDVMAAKEVVTENANGSTTTAAGLYWYPLTTDIMAFLQGYGGYGDGKWYDPATTPNGWMFCLYTEADPVEEPDPSEPEETEPSVPEETEPSAPQGTETAWDDVYNTTNPITAAGEYTVTVEAADWTLIQYNVSKTGWYTFTVNDGLVGYCGNDAAKAAAPTEAAASVTKYITGMAMLPTVAIFAISSDSESVTLTITYSSTEPTEPEETEPTEPTEPEETEPTVPSEPEETEPTVPTEPTVVEKAFDDVYNDANPITATGSYDVTLLDNATWTMYLFKAPEIGDYTISVDKGQCGYAGAGSFYTMVPTKPAASFDRSATSAGQSMVIAIQSEDPNVKLTISKADVNYENVCTPDAALAGMPAGATLFDGSNEYEIVKVSDSEYRLNTEIGPILYVDMSAEQIGWADIQAGAKAYGKVDGITYNFTPAMQAYGAAMGDTSAYPLTTDLMVFLKAYGETQDWYADADAADAWMFCVYVDNGSGDVVEVTNVAEVTGQAVAAEVPHQITWTAAEKGTLNIAAAPEYAANIQYTAFKVLVYANAGDEETVFEGAIQVPGDPWFAPQTAYEVEAGQYVVVELYAMKNYTHCDGTVNATVTFVPYTSAGDGTKEEIAWDDMHDETYPITAAGTYELTLNENAQWTMYMFTPEEIGIYTVSVDGGNLCGYAGAGSFYTYVPDAPAASFEQEVSALGNSIIFAVCGDSNAFNVTIEKTGESQGEQEIVYENWENVHTPDASLSGQPEGTTAVDITQEHTAVMVNDGEYRLDSADGPVLYVNLSNNVFTFSELFGENGALTLRGDYNGGHYDFKTAMSAYNDVMNGSKWYPLTTDLIAFLQGYGTSAGWYAQGYSPIQSVILGTAKTPWMFCVYSVEGAEGPTDPTDPDPTEPTEPTEPDPTEPTVPDETDTNVIAQFADVAVTANGPHIIEGTASADGTLHIEMAGEYWRYQAFIAGTENVAKTYSTYTDNSVTDYAIKAGESYTIKFWAYKSWAYVDGTVSGTVSFIPSSGTEVEQVELAWDDVYNATNPITATDTHELTLVENAEWTMFNFKPTEIGIYTITVSGCDIGYAGGTVSYFNVPSTFGSSVVREVKEVGNVVIFAIRGDDPNVTVTIEKTGESEGNIEFEYIPWENVHTPTADMTVPGGLEVVDITVAHTVVKISDTEYRLDSATGPILYVDLEGTRDDGWSMSMSFPAANTIRAEYNGVYYNFRAPLQEYTGYYETDENGDRVKDENGNEIYHEPQNYGMGEYYDVMSQQSYRYRLTTDLLAFIQGWGVAQGWTIPSMSPFAAIADGTAHPDSAWMVVCMVDPNSAVTTPEEPETEIESANVTLSSVLGVNFTVNAPEGSIVTVTVGGTAVEYTVADNIYTVSVMAQDMLKDIVATVSDAEGNVLAQETFQLAAYVEAILAGEDSDETKALASAVLTYCQYAAAVKGNYDGELAELAEISRDVFKPFKISGQGDSTGISVYAYLEDACELRVRVPDGYTVVIGEDAAEILAQDYDQEFTFTVSNAAGETVYTGSFSVMAYLGAVLYRGVEDETMGGLLKAMYYYYAAAEAYVEAAAAA